MKNPIFCLPQKAGKATVYLLASVMTLICVISMISAKPTMDHEWNNSPQDVGPGPHYELHPIDNCIFACDHCFKVSVSIHPNS